MKKIAVLCLIVVAHAYSLDDKPSHQSGLKQIPKEEIKDLSWIETVIEHKVKPIALLSAIALASSIGFLKTEHHAALDKNQLNFKQNLLFNIAKISTVSALLMLFGVN